MSYFITGTDTNVGKTWVTVSLLSYFKQRKQSVIGMKPVAAGCELAKDGQLYNADALLLQAHSSMLLDYALINPYAYALASSPHLAGFHNPVDISVIQSRFSQLQCLADVILVEGAGGWYSPLNATQANSDLARCLALPVILVVAIKLGCINQARLTYQAICQDGLLCAGWIAVCNDATMLFMNETISTIAQFMTTPLLGILPYKPHANFNELANYLSLSESEFSR